MNNPNERPLKKITNRLLPTQLAALKNKLDGISVNHKERRDSENTFILVFPQSIPQRMQATQILRAQ